MTEDELKQYLGFLTEAAAVIGRLALDWLPRRRYLPRWVRSWLYREMRELWDVLLAIGMLGELEARAVAHPEVEQEAGRLSQMVVTNSTTQ